MERRADGLLYNMDQGALDLALAQLVSSGGLPRGTPRLCSQLLCNGHVPLYGKDTCVHHMTTSQQLVVLDVMRMMDLSKVRRSFESCEK
jgi:hypothetical protein